jgi:hypothetical protein
MCNEAYWAALASDGRSAHDVYDISQLPDPYVPCGKQGMSWRELR